MHLSINNTFLKRKTIKNIAMISSHFLNQIVGILSPFLNKEVSIRCGTSGQNELIDDVLIPEKKYDGVKIWLVLLSKTILKVNISFFSRKLCEAQVILFCWSWISFVCNKRNIPTFCGLETTTVNTVIFVFQSVVAPLNYTYTPPLSTSDGMPSRDAMLTICCYKLSKHVHYPPLACRSQHWNASCF